MANVRDLRRRIKSVSNTMQLTKAMKMVSAAKLRRAQEAITKARPYADAQRRILESLARRASAESHPLLAVRGDRHVELVVMTGDKGLCGSFNANIIRQATQFLKGRDSGEQEVTLHLVGKKGVDFFGRRPWPIHKRYTEAFRQVAFGTAREIAGDLIERFISRDLDAIYLVYNEFRSAISHRVVATRLLPLDDLEVENETETDRLDYLYEPAAEALLERLVPHYVEIQIFRAMLESAAAEHGARMSAMDSATRNAEEMIKSLTLHMNRVRQASITTEIIEVVSGAQALE